MIETRDLLLDKGAISDWKALYQNVWQHEETARYMKWTAQKTEQEGYEMTLRLLEFQKIHPAAYFVYEKQSRTPIGFAGIRDAGNGVFEDAGIAVGPAYTGKGYGKQILAALVHQAFDELGAKKLIYSCWADNTASNHLAQSAGLRFVSCEETIDQRSGKTFMMNYYEKSV